MLNKIISVPVHRFTRYSLVSALVLQGVVGVAQAQVVAPDSGSILRDIQTTLDTPQKEADSVPLELPKDKPSVVADEGGLAILVDQFAITGNTAFSSEQLLALVADQQGKSLTLGQLEQAAAVITQHYQTQGYFLSRAYLPQQDVSGGVVTIAVLEGRLGEIRLDNQSLVRDSVLQRPFSAIEVGQLVTAAPLETPLLQLSDIIGANATATLVPGTLAGSTDLLVKATAPARVSGTVEVDNFGNRYTGEYRLGASLSVASPLGLGDRFDLRALTSDEEQLFFRAQYALPVGPWSTEVGVAWSDMDYELGDQFADIGATGNAQIATAFIRQNLIRTRALNVEAQFQYDHKDLQDKIKTFGSASEKESTLYTFTLAGDLRDGFGGGGITRASLAYTSGDLQINSSLDRVIDSVTAKTEGSFYRWTPSIMRSQNLGGNWSLHAQVQGQFASKNLDSSEKLSLGGAYAVRGFPQGEASGDQGWLANLELRYDVNSAWQVFGLLDHGDLKRNKNRWSDSANSIELTAAGLGARWRYQNLYISGTLATPIDSPSSAIDNRDPRAWVQAVWQF